MTDLDLVVFALTVLGFFPMLALRSLRATVIAGAVGLLATLGTIAIAYIVGPAINDSVAMSNAFILAGVLSLASGALCGAITRGIALTLPSRPWLLRWSVAAAGFLVFAAISRWLLIG